MRLVFLGSPPFGTPVLRRLLESSHEVLAVVTRPDRPRGRGRGVQASQVVLLAQEHGLTLLQPETTRDESFVSALRDLEPDVLLVASYGEILRQEVLELAPRGAFNVHGSLLPRWRGAAPVHRAIMAGDAETGVSVQRMVLALDEGDVLLERRTPIDPAETAGELSARLAEIGGQAATAALDELEAGDATLTVQDPDQVTYAPKLSKADGALDWSRPAAELARLVRGTNPWPGARTSLPDGRELVVLEARVSSGCIQAAPPSNPPGTLQKGEGEAKGGFLVAAGEGVLELLRVKPAGKGAMAGADFLRGARLGPGDILGPGGAPGPGNTSGPSNTSGPEDPTGPGDTSRPDNIPGD